MHERIAVRETYIQPNGARNDCRKPAPLIVLVLAAWAWLTWAWLKRTNFGIALNAVGGDIKGARAVGVSTRFVRFMV
jgi:ribose/xylose/arabinose/galactoside ABC-type transport system permease subunit